MQTINVLDGIIKLCQYYRRKDYQDIVRHMDKNLKRRIMKGIHTENDIVILSKMFHIPKKTLRFMSDFDICKDEKAWRALKMRTTELYIAHIVKFPETPQQKLYKIKYLEARKQKALKQKSWEIFKLDEEIEKLQKEVEEIKIVEKKQKKAEKCILDLPKQKSVEKMWESYINGKITESDIRFGEVDFSNYKWLRKFTTTMVINHTIEKRTFYWQKKIEKSNANNYYAIFVTPYITLDNELGEIEFIVSISDSLRSYELYDCKNAERKVLLEKSGQRLLKEIKEIVENRFIMCYDEIVEK